MKRLQGTETSPLDYITALMLCKVAKKGFDFPENCIIPFKNIHLNKVFSLRESSWLASSALCGWMGECCAVKCFEWLVRLEKWHVIY